MSNELIQVIQTGTSDPLEFEVSVTSKGTTSRHDVTVSKAQCERWVRDSDPASLVTAAFGFLLDRENKESILRRFDIKVIAQYFPEFEQRLPGYLEKGGTPSS